MCFIYKFSHKKNDYPQTKDSRLKFLIRRIDA